MPTLQVRQNRLQRLMQYIPASKIGALLFSHSLHFFDKILMGLSRDRLSIPQLVAGLPCVRLTSTGAKSGISRLTPTIGVPDNENVVLICSNWGQRHHPAWYYNLKKNPQAILQFDNYTGAYVATEITEPSEYDRLWHAASQVYIGYEKYKQRTGGRKIPILSFTTGVNRASLSPSARSLLRHLTGYRSLL